MNYPPYPEYSTTRWTEVGSIPSGWEARRLKFAATCNDEALPETTDPDYEIAYVDISSVDLVNGITAIETHSFDEAPSRARRIVRDGDTIVSTVRTYLKAIAPIESPPDNMIVSTGFAVIRPLESVNSRFLGYALQNTAFINEVVANSTGVSYPAINPTTLICLPISYPDDKTEQQQIAAFLDWKTGQIDALIAKKKLLLEKLKEKRLAVITQAVTKGLNPAAPLRDSGIPWLGDVPKHWEVKRLKFQATEGKGGGIKIGPFGGMLTELIYADNGDFKLYGQENVLSGDFYKGTRWLTLGQFNDLIQYQVEEGDFLFTRKGSIGGCAIFPNLAHPGIIDSDTIRLRVNDKSVDIRFLRYAFQDSLYLQAQVQLTKRGAILSGLNTTTIADLLVAIPPIEEQIEILDFLDQYTTRQIDLECKVESAIARLTEYCTALVTAATTGKIDVRNVAVPSPQPLSRKRARG